VDLAIKNQAELGIGFPVVVKEKKANIACSREEYQVNVPVKLFFNQTENWLGDKPSFTFNIEHDSLIL
jgi:hypothetical protein